MSAELRVVHMPGRMGGEATIGDTRIDCRTIAGRVWAGETVADLADDFGLRRDEVRLACWWLVEHAVENDEWERMARETWGPWAGRWEWMARNGDGDSAGDPLPKLDVVLARQRAIGRPEGAADAARRWADWAKPMSVGPNESSWEEER